MMEKNDEVRVVLRLSSNRSVKLPENLFCSEGT